MLCNHIISLGRIFYLETVRRCRYSAGSLDPFRALPCAIRQTRLTRCLICNLDSLMVRSLRRKRLVGFSGVQRVLDAWGQRRSWMPASEKNFSISIDLENFLMAFFFSHFPTF